MVLSVTPRAPSAPPARPHGEQAAARTQPAALLPSQFAGGAAGPARCLQQLQASSVLRPGSVAGRLLDACPASSHKGFL